MKLPLKIFFLILLLLNSETKSQKKNIRKLDDINNDNDINLNDKSLNDEDENNSCSNQNIENCINHIPSYDDKKNGAEFCCIISYYSQNEIYEIKECVPSNSTFKLSDFYNSQEGIFNASHECKNDKNDNENGQIFVKFNFLLFFCIFGFLVF